MDEWKEIKLGALADIKGGKRLPKGSMLSEIPNSHPYIRTRDINNNKISVNDLLFVPNGIFPSISRYIVEANDVIISIVGTIGLCAIIPAELHFASLTENCAKIVNVKENILDKNYLFYFLTSEDGQAEIESRNVGSTQPKLPIYNIQGIPIPIPPLPEQKAIASVLSSLDDKIDLLHRQNKTLEAMAETLFRQWFVEEAQEDWEEVDLDYVTQKITDGAHKSPPTVEVGLPMASVKDMHQLGIHRDSCRKISEKDYEELVRNDCRPLKNDIIIAKDGSYLKHVFVAPNDLDLVILSSIAILRPNGKYNPLLLSIYLKMNSTCEALENIVTGAVIPRIVLKDFRKFKLTLPPMKQQIDALKTIEPIYIKCWENVKQIRTLEKMRDTLLPKLMSGEVRVNV